MKRFLSFLIAVLLTTNVFASQSSHSISNDNGAAVRAAINTSLQALASNNSGATAPSTTYANMWWYDSSTAILKKRDNANSAWVNVAYNSGSGWIPYYSGTQLGDASTLTKDTDGSLAANSDSKIATQKATKTAIDAVSSAAAGKFSKTTAGEIAALTEKTTLVDDDLFLINDSEASNALKKVKRINAAPTALFVPSNIQVFTSSGTWVKPSGVNKVYVKIWGGGGGGGQGYGGNAICGGGGGGGGYSEGYSVVTGDVSITIGSGGVGANSGSSAGNGGSSSFAGVTTITANGGAKGETLLSYSPGGTGGTASGGIINLSGSDGQECNATSAVSFGGQGGSSFNGPGGNGCATATGCNGQKGAIPGGGGGGAARATGADGVGGAGGKGMAIVYY